MIPYDPKKTRSRAIVELVAPGKTELSSYAKRLRELRLKPGGDGG